ncbi:MAG: GNAT family N-acetyltransferase [Thermoplasmatota archaeon]
MKIRCAHQSDAEQIAENNVCLAKETEHLILSRKEAQKGSEIVFSDREKGFYLVAEHEEKIIGQLFITSEWSDWRNQTIWWIHRVYIKKPWRKKGICTALMQKIKQMAQDLDIFALRLYLLKDNDLAKKIYKKLGFHDTPFLILEEMGQYNR